MKLKRILAALLLLLLMSGLAADALASWQPPDTYEGYGDGQSAQLNGMRDTNTPAKGAGFPFLDVEVYTSSTDSSKTIQDFFGEAGKGLVPGDHRDINVRLKNNYSKTVKFYMKAAARTTEGYPDGQGQTVNDFRDDVDPAASGDIELIHPFFPNKTPYDPLLEATKLTMSCQGAKFFDGDLRGTPVDGQDGPYIESWFYLGTVAPNDELLIQVTLDIDYEYANNAYANRMAAVDWVFYAQELYNPPGPTPTPTPTPTPEEVVTPTLPPQEVVTPTPPPEEPPPTPPGEEEIVVVVPPQKPPKTGDDQVLLIWIILLSAAAIGVVILLVKNNRDDKKGKKEQMKP